MNTIQHLKFTVAALAVVNLPTRYAPQNSLDSVPGSPYAILETALLAGFGQPGSMNSRIS